MGLYSQGNPFSWKMIIGTFLALILNFSTVGHGGGVWGGVRLILAYEAHGFTSILEKRHIFNMQCCAQLKTADSSHKQNLAATRAVSMLSSCDASPFECHHNFNVQCCAQLKNSWYLTKTSSCDESSANALLVWWLIWMPTQIQFAMLCTIENSWFLKTKIQLWREQCQCSHHVMPHLSPITISMCN